MKKLNITTREVVIEKKESYFQLLNGAIEISFGDVWDVNNSLSEEEAKANADLIADAFKVAIEHDFTPTMLLEERQNLMDHIKETEQTMAKIIKSDVTIVNIMKERKEAAKLLAKAKKLLMKANQDPLNGQQQVSVYLTQIEKIGEFIEKTK